MNPDAALTPRASQRHLDLPAGRLGRQGSVMIAAGRLSSLWSWTMIIDKLVRFAALNREADALRGPRSPRAAAWRRSPPTPASNRATPLPRMLQAALREWRDGRGQGRLERGAGRPS